MKEVAVSAAVVAITAAGCGGGQTTSTGKPASASAIQRCEQNVRAAPQLSSGAKSKLQSFCEKAGSGDKKAARDATKQVCKAIVKEKVPSGSARKAALKSCNRSS